MKFELFFLSLSLQVGDLLTTWYGVFLKKIADEMNPLIVNVYVLFFYKLFLCGFLYWMYKNQKKGYSLAMWVIVLLYSWVVVDNFFILQTSS